LFLLSRKGPRVFPWETIYIDVFIYIFSPCSWFKGDVCSQDDFIARAHLTLLYLHSAGVCCDRLPSNSTVGDIIDNNLN